MIVDIRLLRSVVVVRTTAFFLLATCAAATSQCARADDSQPAGTSIVFKRDIQPILALHCYRCHGRHKQAAGLRLDNRAHAERGGDSQQSILGSGLESNLLYQRVTSNDVELRMPRDADPLKAAQVELLAEWVRQETPWPASADTATDDSTSADGSEEALVFRLLGRLEHLGQQYAYLERLGYFGLILLFLVLIVEFCRNAQRNQRSWTTGRARRPIGLVCVFRLSHFVVLFLVVALIVSWRDAVDKIETLTAERDEYRKKLSLRKGPQTSESLYGSPPVPIRPTRSKQVGGTFYRGNCERHPLLFNGGNYRTATFHVGLYDSDYKRVEVGGTLKSGTVYIRFEIERAPKTARAFFRDSLMSTIYLSEHTFKHPSREKVATKPVQLETIEEAQRWAAFYPIGRVEGEREETISGLVYVVMGKPNNETISGSTQYGIKYDLRFAGGTLHEYSDLWMGELYITSPIAHPQPDKVPLNEWFDYRPIPVITGENTKDPKLLGIDENFGDAPNP